MRLLFDANLSPRLVKRIADLFPESAHVFDAGLARETSDLDIWKFAANSGYAVVTTDADFVRLSRERGAPPKVIHI
ncbi:MAG TPA: DUF5615 family PIN-like protein [Candidatus Solibacter sp.]|nr:DUF5615 family PIN-like protein [Candidatus Solibacter sp.]